MYEILEYQKETENKLRWGADVDGTPFELYIPKWRIPDPTPGKVLIRAQDKIKTTNQFTRDEIEQDPELRNKPIYAEITRITELTKTIRFDPIGDKNNWEIGSPYIPKSILPSEDTKKLYVVIEWK